MAASRRSSAEPHQIVFVTSDTYDGDLGGLVGADAKCQALADAAGLDGTFRAWLSDDAESPSTRFTQSTDPYWLVDGTVVADSWADLIHGSIAHAIDLDEAGEAGPDARRARTVHRRLRLRSGTSAAGEALTSHCGGWLDNTSPLIATGERDVLDAGWHVPTSASWSRLTRPTPGAPGPPRSTASSSEPRRLRYGAPKYNASHTGRNA